MAAKEQAIRIRSIKNHIDKESISPLCKICGEREETVAILFPNGRTMCKNNTNSGYMKKLL